jgi:hypothetical protein
MGELSEEIWVTAGVLNKKFPGAIILFPNRSITSTDTLPYPKGTDALIYVEKALKDVFVFSNLTTDVFAKFVPLI